MIAATSHLNSYPAISAAHAGERFEAAGAIVMRCGLALIFLWFGAMKFTSYEAMGVAQFVSPSPLVGGAMGVITFLTTLSFFFTTPGVAEPLAGGFPALSAKPGQFLLKDLGLLGISLYFLGASLVKARADVANHFQRNGLSAEAYSRPCVWILYLGGAVMRYGLALIFVWYGCMKFTSYEATGIAPFIANSPLVGWWHAWLGIQGSSDMLGVIEITTGILLALRAMAPIASAVGGAMATVTFLITLSFFFTTPGVAAPIGFPAISGDVGQFLLKDISIWLVGEALVAAQIRAANGRLDRALGRNVNRAVLR